MMYAKRWGKKKRTPKKEKTTLMKWSISKAK